MNDPGPIQANSVSSQPCVVDRDELLKVRCPSCREVVAEYVPGKLVYIVAGGLKIKRLAEGWCKNCGHAIPFMASDNLAMILKRKGASDEQIKEIFLEVNDE